MSLRVKKLVVLIVIGDVRIFMFHGVRTLTDVLHAHNIKKRISLGEFDKKRFKVYR